MQAAQNFCTMTAKCQNMLKVAANISDIFYKHSENRKGMNKLKISYCQAQGPDHVQVNVTTGSVFFEF